MNLLGRYAKTRTVTAKGAVTVFLGVLLMGCQTVALHPIPVKFDSESSNLPAKPIEQAPKNNPKKAQNKDLPRVFYLLENWF